MAEAEAQRRGARARASDGFGGGGRWGLDLYTRLLTRQSKPEFTFSLMSTLSVTTTGNDNRLIIADKSSIPADKDV